VNKYAVKMELDTKIKNDGNVTELIFPN